MTFSVNLLYFVLLLLFLNGDLVLHGSSSRSGTGIASLCGVRPCRLVTPLPGMCASRALRAFQCVHPMKKLRAPL